MKRASEVTTEWLNTVKLLIQQPGIATIAGVLVKNLTVRLDGRGDVTELWSRGWQEEGFVNVDHAYQSATDFGVVKCWHLHEVHTDQFTVTRGKLQITVIDVRQDSPTFGHVNVFFVGSLMPQIIRIPPRLLHGWKALTMPEVLVINFQSHVYDPHDEFKFPWDCIVPEIWQPQNG